MTVRETGQNFFRTQVCTSGKLYTVYMYKEVQQAIISYYLTGYDFTGSKTENALLASYCMIGCMMLKEAKMIQFVTLA